MNAAQRSGSVPNLYLCTKRRRPSSTIVSEDDGALPNAENDRARIVFSPPFRRLQDRTQVFALEKNASVRNRLTHSLEVSHIGRILATIACDALSKKYPGFPSEPSEIAAIAQTVDSACLVHDIGNPPFGHFGEQAIREWFEQQFESFKHAPNVPAKKRGFARRYQDFLSFDGNAQGFRILTTLQRNHDEFSLNLTMMLLASTVKYPGTADDKGDVTEGKLKKAGIYFTEQKVFDEVWAACGLRSRGEDGSVAHRHPLSYLMEAADDIAYCMSDMEDAVIKRIYEADVVMAYLEEISGNPLIAAALQKAASTVPDRPNEIESFKLAKFTVFRAALILKLIHQVADAFAERLHEERLLGGPPLVDEIPETCNALESLKKFAQTRIYNHRAVHDKELGGGVVLRGILDAFKPLLMYTRRDFLSVVKGERTKNAHTLGPALCSLLPEKGKAMYRHFVETPKVSPSDVEEWMLRAHLVLDYVAGMTDHYALSTYRQVSSP